MIVAIVVSRMIGHLEQPLMFTTAGSKKNPKNSARQGFPGFNYQWSGAELNRRHVDFQSTALPTELPDPVAVF